MTQAARTALAAARGAAPPVAGIAAAVGAIIAVAYVHSAVRASRHAAVRA